MAWVGRNVRDRSCGAQQDDNRSCRAVPGSPRGLKSRCSSLPLVPTPGATASRVFRVESQHSPEPISLWEVPNMNECTSVCPIKYANFVDLFDVPRGLACLCG